MSPMMLASTSETSGATAVSWLDRHEQRRQRGLPTVSVVTGPIGPAVSCVQGWAQSLRRPLVLTAADPPRIEEVVTAWVDRLASERDLVEEAAAWMAPRLNQDLPASILRARSPFELGLLLEASLPRDVPSGAGLVSRWLLERAAAGEALGRGSLAARLDPVLADHPRPWTRVLAALGDMVAVEHQPVLVLNLGNAESGSSFAASRIEATARPAAELATAQPRLTLLLVVAPEELDRYLERSSDSRAKALLRESIVSITSPAPENPGRAVGPAVAQTSPSPDLERSISRLLSDGASAGLIALFEEAARAVEAERSEAAGVPREAEDRARSAAERFLFERLESLPATAGLFQLNATLGFRFGPTRDIEIDLVAKSLGLAVEIDGYHHFQDRDAYRRDRRKDLELQRNGYMIVRILADDVVRRLEDVLDTILAAVAFRQACAR